MVGPPGYNIQTDISHNNKMYVVAQKIEHWVTGLSLVSAALVSILKC